MTEILDDERYIDYEDTVGEGGIQKIGNANRFRNLIKARGISPGNRYRREGYDTRHLRLVLADERADYDEEDLAGVKHSRDNIMDTIQGIGEAAIQPTPEDVQQSA